MLSISLYMHTKLSIIIFLILVSTAVLAIVSDFTLSVAQDLNPPTTGRTSPNVTSTFGTNYTSPNPNINTSVENTTK
jgi:hypothetical protein